MDVVVVDYGLGNLWSVKNAFEFMGANVRLTSDPEVVARSTKLVLPGVGSFGAGMQRLGERGLINALDEAVLKRGVPILGICLGMQLLADTSDEAPGVRGLGWIPGRVCRFPDTNLRLPHMGFNSVRIRATNPLFENTNSSEIDFYFVHSYHYVPESEVHISASTNHGVTFVSAICKDRIFGVQFHPEKSQSNGLSLISRFIKLEVECQSG